MASVSVAVASGTPIAKVCEHIHPHKMPYARAKEIIVMKRALFLIAVLGLFTAAITGCRASAEVEGKDSASITLPR
jgi:hypothetical protein